MNRFKIRRRGQLLFGLMSIALAIWAGIHLLHLLDEAGRLHGGETVFAALLMIGALAMMALVGRSQAGRVAPVLGKYFTRGIRFHELARAIHEKAPQNLFVMGCGNGYLESILKADIATVSIDLQQEDLAFARSLNSHIPNRDFRLMNLYDVTGAFQADEFQAVVVSEVLEHIPDDVRALEGAHHCLATDGTLFVTVPNIDRFANRVRRLLGLKPNYMAKDHDREYTLEDSLMLVEKAGFECHRVSGLDFWMPKDRLFRLLLPIGSPIRHRIACSRPTLATWYLLECHKK